MAGVRVIIQFDGVADAEAMANGMAERCKKVEAEEPGCVQYEVFRSAMNPNRVALIEHWASYEDFDKHWALTQAPRPATPAPPAGSPPPAPAPRRRAELYQQTEYEVVDGVWEASDQAARVKSVRWT
jgi:quinol monooxygenase YgiN